MVLERKCRSMNCFPNQLHHRQQQQQQLLLLLQQQQHQQLQPPKQVLIQLPCLLLLSLQRELQQHLFMQILLTMRTILVPEMTTRRKALELQVIPCLFLQTLSPTTRITTATRRAPRHWLVPTVVIIVLSWISRRAVWTTRLSKSRWTWSRRRTAEPGKPSLTSTRCCSQLLIFSSKNVLISPRWTYCPWTPLAWRTSRRDPGIP